LPTNKCATLKHGGRYGGGMLSPNPKNIAQPVIQPQHLQLQQHHLQKPNNHELELQTYQLTPQPHYQQQNYNIQHNYPSTTMPSYKKPGTGFCETSSILKKHREEVVEMSKPQSSVFSIQTSHHHRQETSDTSRSTKSISIINQPLPEIPKQHQQQQQQQLNTPQVLSASNLNSYRSLQRPASNKPSYPSSGNQQRSKEQRPLIPAKISAPPPILPPKNKQHTRAQQQQQSVPQKSMTRVESYNQYPSKSYEREREKERSRDRGRSSYADDNHHQQQQQQQQHRSVSSKNSNFQTLPHHHHYPSSFSSSGTASKSNRSKADSQNERHNQSYSSKSLQRNSNSRNMSHQQFENYSATEL